ncbi:hypothetical protein Mapa_001743 [Marchantia paleacea]|nr:hypothetical protein Mapa_001743 [Marchantia paleacea]
MRIVEVRSSHGHDSNGQTPQMIESLEDFIESIDHILHAVADLIREPCKPWKATGQTATGHAIQPALLHVKLLAQHTHLVQQSGISIFKHHPRSGQYGHQARVLLTQIGHLARKLLPRRRHLVPILSVSLDTLSRRYD